MFKIGDEVYWDSQHRGDWSRKTGTITAAYQVNGKPRFVVETEGGLRRPHTGVLRYVKHLRADENILTRTRKGKSGA